MRLPILFSLVIACSTSFAAPIPQWPQFHGPNSSGVASISSPLFYGSRVYVAQDGGRVTCFNAKTGEKFFEQERLGADGDCYAPPIAADTLQVKARNPIYATTAIADNKLYVRSERHLWAFGGR